MAYSEEIADRICDAIDGRPGVVERKMFGGVAWLMNGNMACGIIGEDLMVRLERDDAEAALAEENVGRIHRAADAGFHHGRGCRHRRWRRSRVLGGCQRGLRRVAPT